MKEQEKSPEKKLSEIEASKLPDTEFKAMVIRMLKELSENFHSMKPDIETIKRNESQMKTTGTEMRNKLEGITGRVDEAKNQISYLEYKEANNTQSKQ